MSTPLSSKFPFMDLSKVKEANEEAGGVFFTPGIARQFGMRVLPELYGYRYFVTSESPRGVEDRGYTVNHVLPDGSIDTVGEFAGYTTKEEAVKVAMDLASLTKSVHADVTVDGEAWYLTGMELDGYVVVFSQGKGKSQPADQHYRRVAKLVAPGKATRQVLAGPPRVYRIR